ncbi:MAG: thioredoxin domain-containing protein, partial [Chitinophagales bacterium]
IDFSEGGRSGAPKFPMPTNWQYLLRHNYFTQNQNALQASTTTLDKMMMGGIYDQVGGGFARYSVDEVWKVPHFEKMLYDNGQLVTLYAQTYAHTGEKEYANIVQETTQWIERELMSEEGGFYSSLDADSEGEEGKYYVWQAEELDSLLGENSDLLKKYWSVTEHGNWEENNILYKTKDDSTFCKKNNLDINEWNKIVEEAKQVLYIAREERIRPGLDDKILTSWNALMLKGYTDAYRYLGDEHYLDIALQNANFITEKLLKKDNRLDRNYKNNTSSINAFLDDYALTIESFIGLYEVTFDEKWLYKAKDLSEYAIEHFYDEETKLFFYTSDIDAPLVARKMETSDNVIPSSNSTIAKSLYMLGIYFDQQDYKDKSILMLSAMKNHAIQYAPFYSNWAILMDMVVHPPYEIAIVGDNFEEKRKEMQQQFIPNALYMGGKDEGTIPLLEGKLQEGETFVYVCQNKVCKMPTTNVDEAISLIK